MIEDWNDYEYAKEQIDIDVNDEELYRWRGGNNNLVLSMNFALSFISEDLRNKPDLVKDLIDKYPIAFLLTDELRYDRDFVKSVGPKILEYASDELRNDQQFILELVNDIKNSEDKFKESYLELIWNGMSDNLKYNREFMDKIKALDVVSSEKVEDLISEKEKSLYVRSSPLSDMKYEVRNNPDIVKECSFIKGLSDELRDNKEFMMELVTMNEEGYMFASDRLKRDPELLIAASKMHGRNIMFANKELRNDKELIKEIIRRYGYAMDVFEASGDEIKRDPEMVKMAIQDHPDSLTYANVNLQKDQDIIRFAIDRWKNKDYVRKYTVGNFTNEQRVEELEERLRQIEEEEKAKETNSKDELLKELEETRARANKYRELYEKSQALLNEYNELLKQERGDETIEER